MTIKNNINNMYQFDFISQHKVKQSSFIKTGFFIFAIGTYMLIDLSTFAIIHKKSLNVDVNINVQAVMAYNQYQKALENNEVDKAINALGELKKLKTFNLQTDVWESSINSSPQLLEAFVYNKILEGSYNYTNKNGSYILKQYPEKLVSYINSNLPEVIHDLNNTKTIKFNCNWYSALCMLTTNMTQNEYEKNFVGESNFSYKLKQEILYKKEHQKEYKDYWKEINNRDASYHSKNKDKIPLKYPIDPFKKYQSMN